MTSMKKLISSFALVAITSSLTACGGDGKGSVSAYIPPLLAAAQGTWHSPNGCELISGSAVIGSAVFDSQFINNDYVETATYYNDDYCTYGEVRVRTTYNLNVGAAGPGGYGNQIDFYVRSVTMTPLTTNMAADYNYDGSCGYGWQIYGERDIAQYGSCPIYELSSSTMYTEDVGDLIRQIMDVDGNEIYLGIPGGGSYPAYYNNSPSLVR